ncbi:MAG: rod shape-determining protein MreD [Bacilli bacterium]|nr:rod shape-determining protein MreD [Bacilli bacterium]
MIPITLIISFVLDSIISNFISLNSLFAPLFTLMSLIIVYPYFNGNHKNFLVTSFVTGVFYDLIYTNTIVIHGLLFVAIGFIIIKLNTIFSNNYLNVLIMAVISIIIYRLISYGLLLITNNVSFSWVILLKSIYQSLIINIFYILLAFMITDRLSFRFKIKKSE